MYKKPEQGGSLSSYSEEEACAFWGASCLGHHYL